MYVDLMKYVLSLIYISYCFRLINKPVWINTWYWYTISLTRWTFIWSGLVSIYYKRTCYTFNLLSHLFLYNKYYHAIMLMGICDIKYTIYFDGYLWSQFKYWYTYKIWIKIVTDMICKSWNPPNLVQWPVMIYFKII